MAPYLFQPDWTQVRSRGTGVFHAFDYLFSLGVFGFVYWLFNGIIPYFMNISERGVVFDLANFLWGASLVIYLLLGPFYFWNKLKEWTP